jgi:hypothetical protein
MASNWSGNWGQYSNPAADALIQAIPAETDPAALKDDSTRSWSRLYLTDVPSFTLMYRPQSLPHGERERLDELPLRRGRHQPTGAAAEPDRRLEHRRSLQPGRSCSSRRLISSLNIPGFSKNPGHVR